MWTLRRPAALQQIARARAVLHDPLVRSHAAPVGVHAWANARLLTTDSLGGVEVNHVLASTPAQLKAELGRAKLVEVHKALKKEFEAVVAKEGVTAKELKDLFTVAEKTRLDSLLMHSFEQMKQHFPEEIDQFVYSALYRSLVHVKSSKRMWQVYEYGRTQFENVPECVYRLGVVSKLLDNDVAGAKSLLGEMKENGISVSNDIQSRLLLAHANANDVDSVLELYAQLDPQRGLWHEASIDRVLLSLGIVGKPDLAFEFYVNSNMKLNGGTLIALLSVCRHNDCKQQAADILENRKRFDLKLNGRAYNRILETLEFLDRHDEIEEVLNEMNHAGVAFDTKTKAIIARNQEALKGTYFELSAAAAAAAAATAASSEGKAPKTTDRAKKSTHAVAAPVLIQFLQQKKIDEAVKYASGFVRPLTRGDVRGGLVDVSEEQLSKALFVPPSISKLVVSSYIAAGDDATVEKLLEGFLLTLSSSQLALKEIANHYSRGLEANGKVTKQAKRKFELAYRAAKGLIEVGKDGSVDDQLFSPIAFFKDAQAARKLSAQLVKAYSAKSASASESESAGARKPKYNRLTAKKVAHVMHSTLALLGDSNNVDGALALLDEARSYGWTIESSYYATLLRAMRSRSAYALKAKGVVVLAENYSKKPFFYLGEDFERVLSHLEANGGSITRSILSLACLGLAGGERRQRVRLLEAYAQARASHEDFQFPVGVFAMLLRISSKEGGTLDEFRQIYDDAVASLKAAPDASQPRVPLDWETLFVTRLARAGQLDEAMHRLQNMQATSGAYSYEAAVMVLREAIAARHVESAEGAMAFLHQRKFKPTLLDTYDIVHLAKDAELPHLAFDILDLYEEAHGRETGDVVDHSRSRQSAGDKFAVRKIRSMYRVALKLCEQNGEWKRALTLSTRVNELLRFEHDESKKTDEATA